MLTSPATHDPIYNGRTTGEVNRKVIEQCFFFQIPRDLVFIPNSNPAVFVRFMVQFFKKKKGGERLTLTLSRLSSLYTMKY